MYTSPIMSSLTTQLELTFEMPGVDTSPMNIEPMGFSQPTSMTSGIFRQPITLVKPQGGVGSHLNANALAGGRDAGGNRAFDKQSGRIIGIVQASCWVLPLDFGIMAGLGISLVSNTSQDGCNVFSHLAYFGVFFSNIGFSIGCTSGTLVAPGISGNRSDIGSGGNHGTTFFFFREVHSPKNFFISERQIEFYFRPQFYDALHQKASLVPL